jgi:cyclopropane-fatty-acyl-phospholipid synthase
MDMGIHRLGMLSNISHDLDNMTGYAYIMTGFMGLYCYYYYMNRSDNFESMKKLLQENTDIELIRNKDTSTNGLSIIVNNDEFFSKSMTKGDLGVAESYMDGDWDTPDLEGTISNLISNQEKLYKHIYSLEYLFLGLNNYITTFLPSNTLESSKTNISSHYDIGNDLYSKMLGKHMQYTCAYYYKDDLTLDEAQLAKMELVAKKLKLTEGLTVLDIGCGFGSMATHLATNYKVHVLGVTLSQEQAKHHEEYFKHPNVQIKYMDYRNVTGTFDRVYSVGCLEHIGKINYKTYFDKCHSLLKDDGIMLIHTEGASRGKSKNDFIGQYIFPGVELPELSDLTKGYTDQWHLEDLQNFGQSYAKTLRAWNDNIGDWEGLDTYDTKFRRMWEFYLLGCAVAFQMKSIYLWQLVYTKKCNTDFDCYHIRNN